MMKVKCIECGYFGIKKSPSSEEVDIFPFSAYNYYKNSGEDFFNDVWGAAHCYLKNQRYGGFVDQSVINSPGGRETCRAIGRLLEDGTIEYPILPGRKGELLGIQNFESNVTQEIDCNLFFKRRFGYSPKEHVELQYKTEVEKANKKRSWIAILIAIGSLLIAIVATILQFVLK